jgi:hypothetical protein
LTIQVDFRLVAAIAVGQSVHRKAAVLQRHRSPMISRHGHADSYDHALLRQWADL